jgi:alkanesulfonate monooxygenase SsuD/methylene tetrahydromethanopterin reductase-like flavin-dependent oxidoreductase (luciferase family)
VLGGQLIKETEQGPGNACCCGANYAVCANSLRSRRWKEFFDPFVGLTAAAAVTTKLKVGTSVCLVPEHNTMNLAKTIACLDQVSNGRFLFGIGAG